MTEEDIDDFWEDVERIDKILSYIMEITGVLLRTMPEVVSDSVLNKFVAFYAKLIADVPSAKDYEIVTALCFFVDCVEHGQPALVEQVITHLPEKFIQVMAIQKALPSHDEINQDLVQTCVYGMGVLAQKMPAGNFPQNDVLAVIEWILSSDFKTETGLVAKSAENAISSLGKCIYCHGGSNELIESFLGRLPLTTDTEEAPPTHNLLFQQIIAQNPNICKPEQLANLQGAVERIKTTSDQKPELEILDDQGKQMF